MLFLALAGLGQVQQLNTGHDVQQLVMSNEKVVLLLHAGPSERADSFAPTLDEIAHQVPEIAFGRVDTSIDPSGKLGTQFRVPFGTPALRGVFKNAPPHQRQLHYRGSPKLEPVLEWVKAIRDWEGGALPPGWEEDSAANTDASPKPMGEKRRKAPRKSPQKDEV